MSEQATPSNPTDLASRPRSVRSLLPAPLRKWSRKRWIVVGSLVAAIAIIAAGTRTWERVPEGPVYAERLVEEINLAREEQGVGTLGIDECLTAAAVAAAEEYQYMGAITAQADTTACAPGAQEIVTRSLKDAYAVVDRWLGLARWGDLLTDPGAQSIGAGCVRGGTPIEPQVVCSVLVSQAQVGAPADYSPGQPVPDLYPDSTAYAEQLFEATNAARIEAGLDPVLWSECVAKVAKSRAEAVLPTGELEHAPLVAQCEDFTMAAENLVHSVYLPEGAVAAWLNSPGHASNVLNPDLSVVGIWCIASSVDNPTQPAATEDPGTVGGMLCAQVFEGVAP